MKGVALVMVYLRWNPGSLLRWDIEEVLSGTGGDQLHVMFADVIKSFDTVDRSILDCALGRLGLPDWFRNVLVLGGAPFISPILYHSSVSGVF